MIELKKPIPDFHTHLPFFKLKLTPDTGLKQFQSQGLSPLLLDLHLMVLLELKVKKLSLMLKILKNYLTLKLNLPTQDFLMPQLFSKLIPTSHQHTGPKKFQFQDLSPLLLLPLEMLA